MSQETEQGLEFVDENKVEDIKYTFLEKEEEAVVPVETEVVTVEETPEVVIEEIAPVVLETQEEEEEDEYEAVELDENLALQYLAESKGMTVEEFQDSLTPKQQKKYAPEIEKFQEFVEKTGNHSYKDFEATQKDWTQEPSEVVLKELLRTENPTLNQKEIDFLYDKKYSFDEDIDDEDVVMERQINTKVDLKKAHSYLDKQKEEFMVNRGSDDYIPEDYRNAKADLESYQQQQESIEAARKSNLNDYISKIESVFSKDLDGVKIRLGNDEIGYEEVSIKPDNLEDIKSSILDITSFNKKFFDEKTGELSKPLDFVKTISRGLSYEADMNKAYNRGIARKAELDDKLSKNIQPDNIRATGENKSTGWSFSVD